MCPKKFYLEVHYKFLYLLNFYFIFSCCVVIDYTHLFLSEIIPKFAEEWKLIDKETKTKLMNEYREKLQKYPDTLQQYYLSLTEAQRLELETVRNEKDASAQKRKLRLENRKTGKPIRPVNQFGIFVKEVFPKVSAGDSGKPNVQVSRIITNFKVFIYKL